MEETGLLTETLDSGVVVPKDPDTAFNHIVDQTIALKHLHQLAMKQLFAKHQEVERLNEENQSLKGELAQAQQISAYPLLPHRSSARSSLDTLASLVSSNTFDGNHGVQVGHAPLSVKDPGLQLPDQLDESLRGLTEWEDSMNDVDKDVGNDGRSDKVDSLTPRETHLKVARDKNNKKRKSRKG